MADFVHGTREARVRIVCVGPALSGKTTNVKCVARQLGVAVHGSETEGERTPMMDWAVIGAPLPHGWKLRLQMRSLPGQLQYEDSRRLFLRKPDAIIFVADSHPARMDANRFALHQVVGILEELGTDLAQVPFIMQYNKRDLPAGAKMSWREMDSQLNREGPAGAIAFCASAAEGIGVWETFRAAYHRVKPRVEEELRSRLGVE